MDSSSDIKNVQASPVPEDPEKKKKKLEKEKEREREKAEKLAKFNKKKEAQVTNLPFYSFIHSFISSSINFFFVVVFGFSN